MPFNLLMPTLFLLGCLTTVSAHGGESSNGLEVGLTTGQTLLFSLVGGLAAMQATSVLFNIRSTSLSPLMVGLATYTGLIHLILGFDDRLLLLGGELASLACWRSWWSLNFLRNGSVWPCWAFAA